MSERQNCAGAVYYTRLPYRFIKVLETASTQADTPFFMI
jgi:hypothetical protein